MASVGRTEQYDDWKKRAFLGALPHGFLRVEESPRQQQEAADQQAALALQHHLQSAPPMIAARMGRLSVTITQAKLMKNYGMTRMDPYVRLRVGHSIYETHTDTNGGKNPHWNKVLQCYLPPGVSQIYVEIYDECSFTMDELIAWGHIEIPPQVIQKGETHEDWYPLSGKQGDNQEGMINMVLSYTANPGNPYFAPAPVMMVPSTNMYGIPQYAPVNIYTAPPVVNAVPVAEPCLRPNAEVELKQIAEMFPNIDSEVIKSVYDANQGKKDVTINSLLQMCE
ncbi:toll-interacting protein-like [Athalia rosae]|uniref:toll-interacting protein-like n=1 Tax=Athalia rosae TaxID=37344 RepID=UPI002033D292|nr:toll-interacting protein-like [Athalia rosae]